jgi:uncharacterized coiled-coil protein SlyX
MPALAYVGCVEISAHDADTVYLTATRYKLADYQPYLFRSTDSGRSWQSINGNFPTGEITRVLRADPVRRGLLFVGTETGIFFSLDDGGTWTRMPGGLPVVPVYDLKIKGADLVAATHGRSFWILDDISPLRALADGNTGTRLFAPRTTIRTRLHFGAMGGVRGAVSFALCFGIGGGVANVEQPDGTKRREHLDVGENPPNGAIVWYWLDADAAGPVALTFRDTAGAAIITFRSDDEALPVARRPTTRRGLNRFVWDLKHPGPVRIDASLVTLKNKPLAAEPDAQAGPTTVPGDYRVELAVGSVTLGADFSVAMDPRIASSPQDLARQFALQKELIDSLSTLNGTVNRIRRIKRQLAVLVDRLGESQADLVAKARTASERLSAIEGVLVDVDRQSPRDILRHPAGLNDTLTKLFSLVTMSDGAPTAQAEAVAHGIMARVGGEVTKLDAVLTTDVAEVNRMTAAGLVALVGD